MPGFFFFYICAQGTYTLICKLQMEIKEMEVVLRCKNDVCVGALFVNFTCGLSCISLLVSRGCYIIVSRFIVGY